MAGVHYQMTRNQIKAEVKRLGPWYQNIRLPGFIWTRPWNRETLGQWVHCERGERKLNRFILPMLPVPLQGASVLEVGTNAGGNLLWTARQGARACYAFEPNRHYFDQMLLVMKSHHAAQWYAFPRTYADLDAFYIGKQWDTPAHDIGFCLNVIYHLDLDERVPLLRSMGKTCRYVVLQGNGLGDQPDGRGVTSLLGYIRDAGLKVHSCRCEPHVRGLVVVATK